MSRQRLENQAKSFLLEVDQEYEINEILSSEHKNINGTQLIHQINFNSRMPSALKAIGGWNGDLENTNIGKLFPTNNQQKQANNTISKNMRAISAQNQISPRTMMNPVKVQGDESINFIGEIKRKNSLQIQETKRSLNNRLQRSFDKEQQSQLIQEKLILKQLDKISQNNLSSYSNDLYNKQSTLMADVFRVNEYDSDEEEDTLQKIGKKRQARVVNKIQQKINVISNTPKNLEQPKLNLFDQVNARQTSVFTPLTFSKQLSPQQASHFTSYISSSPQTLNLNNQNKLKVDLIQEKIQQYLELNDKTIDAFKKMSEVRRNSLLLQKNTSKQLPIQTHEFIPIDHLNPESTKQKELNELTRLKQFHENMKQKDLNDIQKQRENYRNYLEQPGLMPQIANSNSKSFLTPRNNSSLNKYQPSQSPQMLIKNDPHSNTAQNTPLKSKNYKLTPTETKRLIDHIEKQGRNYLSSSPTKTKNNGIKFRISKKASIIDTPTIQVTPQHLNSYTNNIVNHTTILDSINFEDENQNSMNNMKQMILQKISQQSTTNQIIDSSLKSQNLYKSIKKQRTPSNIHTNTNNNNSNIGILFQNSIYKGGGGAQNQNSVFQSDQSNYSSSIQMENSSILASNKLYDGNLNNIRSQNQCKVEDFFIPKHETHTAPLKNRPRVNLQKLNIVKQMNFELENALCRQSPISSVLQNGKQQEYNHQVSLNLPSQQRMNKIITFDQQYQQLNEVEKPAHRMTPSYRSNNIERKRVKASTQGHHSQHHEYQISEQAIQSSPPHQELVSKERIFARSKENQQIHLNQLSTNPTRVNEKSISLHPKNVF